MQIDVYHMREIWYSHLPLTTRFTTSTLRALTVFLFMGLVYQSSFLNLLTDTDVLSMIVLTIAWCWNEQRLIKQFNSDLLKAQQIVTITSIISRLMNKHR